MQRHGSLSGRHALYDRMFRRQHLVGATRNFGRTQYQRMIVAPQGNQPVLAEIERLELAPVIGEIQLPQDHAEELAACIAQRPRHDQHLLLSSAPDKHIGNHQPCVRMVAQLMKIGTISRVDVAHVHLTGKIEQLALCIEHAIARHLVAVKHRPLQCGAYLG